MTTAGIIGTAIVLGGLGFGGGKFGCSSTSFEMGDCLRKKSHINLHKEVGYWFFVVDKTDNGDPVICQGQYGDGSIDNQWYGCDVQDYALDLYKKAECPSWSVRKYEAPPYAGKRSGE